MRNSGLEEAQAGVKVAGRNINNLRLKLNIQKTKIIVSNPITSWQIDGGTAETETEFIWGAPKSLPIVTAAVKLKDACSLEEKL